MPVIRGLLAAFQSRDLQMRLSIPSAICLCTSLGACRQEPLTPAPKTERDQVSQVQDRVGQTQVPDCSGPEQWPTRMAFVELKNAGITDNARLNFEKTKVSRLASEQIKGDLFRQVHLITFTEKSGNTIEVITMNDASNEACSMSGVEVFVISRRLGRT